MSQSLALNSTFSHWLAFMLWLPDRRTLSVGIVSWSVRDAGSSSFPFICPILYVCL